MSQKNNQKNNPKSILKTPKSSTEAKFQKYFEVIRSPPTPPSQPAKKTLTITSTEIATGSSMDMDIDQFQQMDDAAQRTEMFKLLCKNSNALRSVSDSVAALEKHADDTDRAVKENSENIDMLKKENKALRDAFKNLDNKFNVLQATQIKEATKRDENEAVNRKLCLEINGIPQSPTETRDDCRANVAKVMKLLKMPEDASKSIDDAHRKMGGGMIVKFNTRTDAQKMFALRFNLRGKTSAELDGYDHLPGNDLYINESLTIDRSRLRAQVSQKVKIFNQGREKDDRIKLSSSDGVVSFTNRHGKWTKCRSMADFDMVYQNSLQVKEFN